MKPALLLLDLQNDFFERETLSPSAQVLIERATRLLLGCREAMIPVFHVYTQVLADGSDRMPHWKRDDIWACVQGTHGALAPEPLQRVEGETVFCKQFFSAFGNQEFSAALCDNDVDVLIVAGLYLHGCVRATVMDAYERGVRVWVADDVVGSTEADHAEITRMYLNHRAAAFLDTESVLARLKTSGRSRTRSPDSNVVPVANIGGSWLAADDHTTIPRRKPANWSETIACIPVATDVEVAAAAESTSNAQREWSRKTAAHRASIIDSWADIVADKKESLVQLLALEIGKPVSDGRKEIDFAVSLIRATARLVVEGIESVKPLDPLARVRYRPHGVVGLMTPWNNPVAIPAGKIAPALGFGNGVIWKPAIQAPRTAMAVMESLLKTGIDSDLASLVFGDASTARCVIDHRAVAAVSLTGSIESGKGAQTRCTRLGKPLQAELGGNNAALVLRDCDVAGEAAGMAAAAFSFAGQRCTSIQRFIVEREILDKFVHEFVAAVESLRIGDPMSPETEIGPMISRGHQQAIRAAVERAESEGAQIYCGGKTPAGLENGTWLAPAVIGNVRPDSHLAQHEVFGPVAAVLAADDLDEAIQIANGVQQGLVATLYSNDDFKRRQFAEAIQAGIVKLAPGPLDVDPSAPFGGWKASQFGPPEHGVWDREFYTRVQATYE